ncbi:proteasome accessory factor B/proteasome accessory factor C [Actinomyces ruminicola]|uniref:Proteasome accessory factor B/proteasome accessory factor C n=1 Tax=Actinomyces ruminicola TaxID=332524 RepID=A0A1H0CXH7_9ACTO|nr:proteasome accessory factor B/proteasome accessory factor C [Actinomyces ruminicola]
MFRPLLRSRSAYAGTVPQSVPHPDPAALPAEERQVNLLLALRNTATGLTKTQIIQTVAGYHPDAGASADRMFERDKGVLRELGIELTTTGQGEETRYRITDADYALPDLSLTAEQAAAVELAASAWRSGALTPAARRALTKIRAVAGADADAGALPDLSIDLGSDVSGGQVPAELAAAVQERRRVSFDYASAGSGRVGARVVEPHRLRMSEGAWYLDGLDRASGQQRTFRLARVVGPVSPVSEAGAFPIPEAPAPVPTGALIAVAPDRALQLRSRALATYGAAELAARPAPHGLPEPAGELLPELAGRLPAHWDVIHVAFSDRFAFAGALAALADAVVVLAPQALRDDVLAHLHAVAALTASPQPQEV